MKYNSYCMRKNNYYVNGMITQVNVGDVESCVSHSKRNKAAGLDDITNVLAIGHK